MTQRIAYVVPTKDRPDDLGVLLRSLRAQTVLPDQIVIVDGSDDPVRNVIDGFADLPIRYLREYPPSLARQRNAGMAALADDITVAGYLDDDLELQADATEKMLRFWEDAGPDVGGAGFSIINQSSVRPALIDRFFMLNATQPGRLLRSGYASSIPFVEHTIETEWIYGGATIWRREVVRDLQYDEWYIGHGYLEDIDYSSRVHDRYRLFIVGDARTHHWSRPVRPEQLYVVGQQEILNRVYFARKRHVSKVLLGWAMTGRVALNLVAALKARDRHHWRRLRGNAEGAWAVVRRRSDAFGGSWK